MRFAGRGAVPLVLEMHGARVMNAGFDHFLPKPYLPEALVGLLHRALKS